MEMAWLANANELLTNYRLADLVWYELQYLQQYYCITAIYICVRVNCHSSFKYEANLNKLIICYITEII